MDHSPGLPIDTLDAEAFSPLGAQPLVLLDVVDLPRSLPPAILIAVDRMGELPAVGPARFDALVTTRQGVIERAVHHVLACGQVDRVARA